MRLGMSGRMGHNKCSTSVVMVMYMSDTNHILHLSMSDMMGDMYYRHLI
jgi:hypothetical protein